MNMPKPSSIPVGDRKAMQNAAYRAHRLGTPDPMKISAQDIRDTLYKAKSREHFEELLREQGVEPFFDRHKDQKIYGWKLRANGATEWLKASTLLILTQT